MRETERITGSTRMNEFDWGAVEVEGGWKGGKGLLH